MNEWMIVYMYERKKMEILQQEILEMRRETKITSVHGVL